MNVRMPSLFVSLFASAALLAPAVAAAQAPTPSPEGTPDWTSAPAPTPEPLARPDETLEEGAPGAPPVVHGFVTVRYLVDDGAGLAYQSENGYDVQYARINVDGKAHPLVAYFVSMELGDVKVFNGNVFREAYVIWQPNPQNKWVRRFLPELRAGRMRRPGGLESFEDEGTLLAMDRTLVSGFMKGDDQQAPGQDFRDIGVRANAVSGPIEAMALGMGNGSKNSSANSPSDEDDSKDFAGRIGFRVGNENGPFFLRTGASSGSGQDDHTHLYSITGDVRVEYWNAGADLTVKAGPAIFQSEVVYGKRTLLDPVTAKGIDTATGSAAYVLAGWDIRRKATPFFRFAYREPTMDGDEDFQRIRDWSNEITAGVNVALVKKRLTARAQYTVRSGFIAPHPQTASAPAFNKSLNGVAQASIQADF